MSELTTDSAALAKEAEHFGKIAGELKTVIGQVESTGSELQSHWKGASGTATGQALADFHGAAQNQVKELDEISSQLHGAGLEYTSADEDHASSLQAGMQF